jgi:hypothetical protein
MEKLEKQVAALAAMLTAKPAAKQAKAPAKPDEAEKKG